MSGSTYLLAALQALLLFAVAATIAVQVRVRREQRAITELNERNRELLERNRREIDRLAAALFHVEGPS